MPGGDQWRPWRARCGQVYGSVARCKSAAIARRAANPVIRHRVAQESAMRRDNCAMSLRARRPAAALPCVGAAAALLCACSPNLDWRELRPANAAVMVTMPCKPSSQSRKLRLADTTVELALHACSAAGATWALSYADMIDPGKVTPALMELQSAARANVSATQVTAQPARVSGATPNVQSVLAVIEGTMPDGSKVQEHIVVFAKATRVYQATVAGPTVAPGAAQVFFESIRSLP